MSEKEPYRTIYNIYRTLLGPSNSSENLPGTPVSLHSCLLIPGFRLMFNKVNRDYQTVCGFVGQT